MTRRRVLLLFLTAFAILFGWIVALDRDDDAERGAVAHLLASYGDALREGALDEARAHHTTQAYQARWSALVFQTGHLRNAEELGPLVRLRLAPEALGHTHDADGAEVVRAVVRWEGERSTAITLFDLLEERGALRIHRTWAWPDDGLGYERVW